MYSLFILDTTKITNFKQLLQFSVPRQRSVNQPVESSLLRNFDYPDNIIVLRLTLITKIG